MAPKVQDAQFASLVDLLLRCHGLPPSFRTTDHQLATESYLVAKLSNLVHAHGHIVHSQIGALLHLTHADAQVIVNLLLRSHGQSVYLLDTYLVGHQGVANLVDKLSLLLSSTMNTCVAVDEAALSLKISSGLIISVLDRHPQPHIFRDLVDRSTLFSSQFRSYLAEQVSSELQTATEPVDLKPIMSKYKCPPGLWEETLHALSSTVSGRFSGLSLYTPAIHESQQTQNAIDMLKLAGYLRTNTIPKSVVPDLPKDVWTLNSTIMSAQHAIQLKETILVLLEEPNTTHVEVTGLASSLDTIQDACEFVQQAFHHSEQVLISKSGTCLAVRFRLINECVRMCIDPQHIESITSQLCAEIQLGRFAYSNFGDAWDNECEQNNMIRLRLEEQLHSIPRDLLDPIYQDLTRAVHFILDEAMIHRTHPQSMVLHWAAKLHIYLHEGILQLGKVGNIPKSVIKKLDRHLLQRIGVPLRDALLIFIPNGSAQDEIRQTLIQAIHTKSSTVFEKLVHAIASSQRIALPDAGGIESVRQHINSRLKLSSPESKVYLNARNSFAYNLMVQRGIYLVLDECIPTDIITILQQTLY